MIENHDVLRQIFEGTMLACFGFSWPFSIYKTWKYKRVEGKSAIFLILVFIGYLAGVTAKLLKAGFGGTLPEEVTVLYLTNTLLVGIDICLYFKYRKKAEPQENPIPHE